MIARVLLCRTVLYRCATTATLILQKLLGSRSFLLRSSQVRLGIRVCELRCVVPMGYVGGHFRWLAKVVTFRNYSTTTVMKFKTRTRQGHCDGWLGSSSGVKVSFGGCSCWSSDNVGRLRYCSSRAGSRIRLRRINFWPNYLVTVAMFCSIDISDQRIFFVNQIWSECAAFWLWIPAEVFAGVLALT